MLLCILGIVEKGVRTGFKENEMIGEEFASGDSLIPHLDPRVKNVAVALFSVVVASSNRFAVLLLSRVCVFLFVRICVYKCDLYSFLNKNVWNPKQANY